VCFTTPITSVVPSPVRKAVVNSWGHLADSVWKSIFPRATWPLLVAQKASNDEHSTGRPSAVKQDNAQTPETKQGDVFGGPSCIRAQRGRYRRWRTRNVCGRTARTRRASRAGIRNLHRRSRAHSRLALAVRGDHRGHGIHGGVLDFPLRDPGATRNPSLFSECAPHEERTGTPHRLARVPMAAIPAIGRITALFVSTRGEH